MILVIFQILLWLVLGRPQSSETVSHWQQAITRNLYILFYVCVIILGVSGFFQATASGISVKFWGLPVPAGKKKDPDLAGFTEALHGISSLALVVLVVIWIGVILLKTYQQNKIFYGNALSKKIKSEVTSPPLSKAILRLVRNLRLLGWTAFWIQFGLAIASALLLLFTTSGQSLSPNQLSSGLTWAVYDFIILCLTTLFFFYYTRLAKKITLKPNFYINPEKKSSPWFLRLSYKTSLLGMLVSFIGIGTSLYLLIAKTVSQPPGIAITDPSKIVRALDVFILLINFGLLIAHFIGAVISIWVTVLASGAHKKMLLADPPANNSLIT
ncbi:hypothetical protein NOC27_1092 [Nitrosococcus oceani AFC27]|nr:hypothetical protein NOC27_1092 [Nitrosococcus oceani AFC27]GEM20424.1 cytochrome b561 [Nitrosococcus oceani]